MIYTYDSIIKIVKEQGYNDSQARMVYNEENLSYYEGKEKTDANYNEIVTLCNDWWLILERMCGYYKPT